MTPAPPFRPGVAPTDAVATERHGVRLFLGGLGTALVAAVLWWTGRAVPGPDSYDGAGFSEWLVTTDPVVAAFVVVRLAGLSLVAWLVLSTGLALVVHRTPLRRRARLARVVDRLCLPAVRRLAHAGVGLAMTAATVAPGATSAGAAEAPLPTRAEIATVTALDHTPVMVGTSPDRATISALPDESEATLPAPATWRIEPGQHLWHVAAETLEAHLGHPPVDHAVAAYLDVLVEANRARLVVPDDPDLVFSGQVLVLPPPADHLR